MDYLKTFFIFFYFWWDLTTKTIAWSYKRRKVQNKRNKEIKKKRKMAEENLSNFPPRLQGALITQALQAKQ